MAGRALALAMLALCVACATEHHTTVIAAEAVGVSEAQLVAASQAACESYGMVRGTAVFDRCVRDEFAARRPG